MYLNEEEKNRYNDGRIINMFKFILKRVQLDGRTVRKTSH